MNRRIALTLKRAFDIVISLTVLTLLLPLMALIALALCNSEAVLHRAGHQARSFLSSVFPVCVGQRFDVSLCIVTYK